MDEPVFLTWAEMMYLHEISIERFGGTLGIRDPGLVESALASARNTFYYGRGDVFDVSATYAFHIAEAQAFLDGNKRTAAAAALSFLRRNGVALIVDDGRIYDAMIAVAGKQLDKAGLAALLRTMAKLQ